MCAITERSSIKSRTPCRPNSGTSRKIIKSTIWKMRCLLRYESSKELSTSSMLASCALWSLVARSVAARLAGTRPRMETAQRCLISLISSSEGGRRGGPSVLFGKRVARRVRRTAGKKMGFKMRLCMTLESSLDQLIVSK